MIVMGPVPSRPQARWFTPTDTTAEAEVHWRREGIFVVSTGGFPVNRGVNQENNYLRHK